MKNIILITIVFNVCFLAQAGGGSTVTDWNLRVGGGSTNGDWRPQSVIDLSSRSGVVTDSDTWKKINDMKKVGDFDFDSISDRWLLKTKSRILSVSDIDLVEKYESKQVEVNNISQDVKLKNTSVPQRFMKRYIQRNVKFKDYIVEDFDY